MGIVETGASLVTLVDFFLNRRPKGPTPTGTPRGVPSLPPRRDFITNAPDALDRPFVGRKQMLADLDDALMHPNGAMAVTPAATMVGHGGVGKTTLALVYATAQARLGRFEGIWVFPAEDEATLLASVETLGLALEQQKPPGLPAAQWAQHVWGVLARSAHPWLLVFDNAPGHGALRPHLPPQAARNLRIIVTSREDDWPDRFGRVGVEPMPINEAVELLTQEAGREDDPDGAASLAEALDRLPLALVIAGAYARDAQRSFAEVEGEIGALMSAAKPGDYPDKLGAALDLTLARIAADEDTGPDEAALLSLLPWLAPEGIDAGLVLDVAEEDFVEGSEADIPGAIRALAGEGARLQAAISALVRRSLARKDGAGRDRTVALHRITAQILRARDAAQADDRRRAAAAVVAASYPRGARGPANIASWDECRRLNPHVAALFAPPAAGAGDTAAPPASAAMDFLLNQASIFHQQQAASDIALAYARGALALKIARLGPDDPEVGIGHDSLGGALGDAGKWAEAVTEYREALRIAEAQGPDYALLGAALSNLAWAMKGELDAAPPDAAAREARLREVAALERRAYKHDRRLHGALHDETATDLNNLANTYDALGDRRRARRISALALATRREVLAPGDPSLATTLNNLGSYHLKDRAPKRALPLMEEALAIREAAFADNPRHPYRIGTAQWLALCHLALPTPDAAGAAALCKKYDLDYDALAPRAQQFRPLT